MLLIAGQLGTGAAKRPQASRAPLERTEKTTAGKAQRQQQAKVHTDHGVGLVHGLQLLLQHLVGGHVCRQAGRQGHQVSLLPPNPTPLGPARAHRAKEHAPASSP